MNYVDVTKAERLLEDPKFRDSIEKTGSRGAKSALGISKPGLLSGWVNR
jgi:hypothetical protein